MKALVYTRPHELAYRDVAEPLPSVGEVLVAIEAAGICGSDLHAYHGHDPRRVPPLILGHEVSARIVAGPGTGRRVTVNPLVTCGTCEYCVSGRDNLCARRTMIGMTRAGGFAERMAVPERCLIEVPQDMSPRQAALAEPAATALHAIRRAIESLPRPLPEARVQIAGGGAIGLLAALLLAAYGCRDVRLGETNPRRRAAAGRAATCTVYDPLESKGAEGDSVDLAIDAVGAKATRAALLAALKPGGVMVHVGLMDWASEIDMRKLTLAEITLIGTYTYPTADLRAAVAALARGLFGDLAWVEERRLAEGAGAFADLDRGHSPSAKILLLP